VVLSLLSPASAIPEPLLPSPEPLLDLFARATSVAVITAVAGAFYLTVLFYLGWD